MSTQEQLHSGRRNKIKRGFTLSALATLVFITIGSSTAKANTVTHWNEIATRVLKRLLDRVHICLATGRGIWKICVIYSSRKSLPKALSCLSS